MRIRACLVFASLALACACGSSANRGKIGEWVKGKSMDIRVTVVREGDLELPQLDYRNHSEHEIDILPCRFRVQYQQGPVFEGTNACDGSGMKIAPGKSLTGFATMRFKDAPAQGTLASVDVSLGKQPELMPERFVFER